MDICASRYPAVRLKHAAEKTCTSSICLRGQRAPDHNTINRFRKDILTQEAGQDILRQLVIMLHERGLLSLEAAFIDGTKIEANANKYSFCLEESNSQKDRQVAEENP